ADGGSLAMTARLAAAPAAARDGEGSSAPRSPKHRCRGFAVRRRSVGNPRPGSRLRAAKQAPAGDDRRAGGRGPRRGRSGAAGPACARREDRPSARPTPRSPRLPANDRQLMAKQEDLELLRALRSAQQHDQLKQPTERHIDERPNHARPPEIGEGEGIEPPAKPTAQTANRVSEPHAPARAPPGLPEPRVDTRLAAAADAGSPAHVGARGSRVPSSAPICTGARPAEPDGRAPDRRTTRPRQPPESGKAEAIDVRAAPALRARIEFLNPTGYSR